ncbi:MULTISPECIES: hypothetical protein [unclassified Myroides]|uniref:hypothetical protein n=1 Tax=unclassified Myroides TaxID=2642485 RepID=UPI003D2F6169
MKKLFMFLAVAGLATFGASCSSDDSKGGDEVKQLTISSDAKDNTVEEGTSVKFTAKVDGKEEAGAAFYVDGTKVTNPYKFDKKGTYKVVAKKDKFKDSEALTITVKETGTPPVEKRTLVLTATPLEVTKGGNVTFTVKDDKGDTVAGAVIKKADGTVVTSPWKSDAVGTVIFTATKDDYIASNEVSVVVKEEAALGNNQVSFEGVLHDVNISVYELAVRTWNAGTENAFQGPGIYNFPGGGYAYLYYVNIYDFDGSAIGNQGWVAVLVKNPTITVEGDTITNLGEMVYPGANANTKAMNGFFLLGEDQLVIENGDVETFAVTQIEFNEEGEGTSKFNLVASVEGSALKLNFDGPAVFDLYDTEAQGNGAQASARGIKSNRSAAKAAVASKGLKFSAVKK